MKFEHVVQIVQIAQVTPKCAGARLKIKPLRARPGFKLLSPVLEVCGQLRLNKEMRRSDETTTYTDNTGITVIQYITDRNSKTPYI